MRAATENEGGGGDTMRDIPPIVSLDDHVIEPPHAWQRWSRMGPISFEQTRPGSYDVAARLADYPHQDWTWPDTRAAVERFADQLTDEELRMILRDNALELLGLP